MKTLETTICGNESCLREICHKIDPTYVFPVDPFDGQRFGEAGREYDRGCVLHLHFAIINNELKIVGHEERWLHHGGACGTLHTSEGGPGFERLV